MSFKTGKCKDTGVMEFSEETVGETNSCAEAWLRICTRAYEVEVESGLVVRLSGRDDPLLAEAAWTGSDEGSSDRGGR